MKKVVLVDDEPLALERLRNILNRYEDYDIIGEYLNATDAMQGIKTGKPDIVVTDICMAEIDGLNMIEKLEQRNSGMMGIIIVSGYDRFDYAKRALKLGVGDYLLKPVCEDEFIETLNEVSKTLDDNYEKIYVNVSASGVDDKLQKELVNAEKIVELTCSYNIEDLENVIDELELSLRDRESDENSYIRFYKLVFVLLDNKYHSENSEFQDIWTSYKPD